MFFAILHKTRKEGRGEGESEEKKEGGELGTKGKWTSRRGMEGRYRTGRGKGRTVEGREGYNNALK